MAVSSVSIFNTPQASDDTFQGVTEDSNGTFIFDVMSDDLGGKAKTLYSLDDGSATTDLLAKDAVGVDNFSLHGALIEITQDGKVAYTMTATSKAYFQSLG